MSSRFIDYYRCPAEYSRYFRYREFHTTTGYFTFGPDATFYGHYHGHRLADRPQEYLHDASEDVVLRDNEVYLPFDPDELVDNLRREEYINHWRAGTLSHFADLYYFLRPALPVVLRRRLQKFHVRGWEKLSFPRWPVDCSVDELFTILMLLSLRASRAERIPFIWFWPDGKSSCAIMTHDVESARGRDFCATLMDVDDSRSIKSSFQIVPEQRYDVSESFLRSVRERGFELAVHDLNHDGHLYRNRAQFLRRAAKVNLYLQQYHTQGFRAGVLYRRQLWYDALKCSYDMSVPNVAHLDPQRGGCCTVMPYFIGDVLELPVTTVQDYTLFHILRDYSIDLWSRQTELIMQRHGMMSFIVHPDYIMNRQAQQVYESLLDHLAHLRQEHGVWIATPGEVNQWWRRRAAMKLTNVDGRWKIEGEGSEHARIAYAREVNGHLSMTLAQPREGLSGDPALARVSHRNNVISMPSRRMH